MGPGPINGALHPTKKKGHEFRAAHDNKELYPAGRFVPAPSLKDNAGFAEEEASEVVEEEAGIFGVVDDDEDEEDGRAAVVAGANSPIATRC